MSNIESRWRLGMALTFYSPAYLQKQLTDGHGRAAAILGKARSLAAGVAAREPV